ncbi:hypothetical protein NDU88_001586 [Pleurodeles waltl]|uniref:Uncharacterized protein n=1 Tax=Pleurodeles waltl TaxID=8319 RepID=A0AAV7MT63_PLEWA|nr:hypothetical protein NDU88_001586 [Pleurodeles waltl]
MFAPAMPPDFRQHPKGVKDRPELRHYSLPRRTAPGPSPPTEVSTGRKALPAAVRYSARLCPTGAPARRLNLLYRKRPTCTRR